MKFRIQIVTEESELWNTIEIDTTEKNWDTANSIHELGIEIIDEIRRYIKSN